MHDLEAYKISFFLIFFQITFRSMMPTQPFSCYIQHFLNGTFFIIRLSPFSQPFRFSFELFSTLTQILICGIYYRNISCDFVLKSLFFIQLFLVLFQIFKRISFYQRWDQCFEHLVLVIYFNIKTGVNSKNIIYRFRTP